MRRRDAASVAAAVGGAHRRLRDRDDAVVHVQLRDDRPVHAAPPAGGVGRGLWEGQWQATWSGRLQNELTHLADDTDDRAGSIERVERGRRPRAPAVRADARLRPSVAGHPPHLDRRRPTRSEHATARVAADRRIPARRPREPPRGIRSRISHAASRAASSFCGPAKFRSATARSTTCRRG